MKMHIMWTAGLAVLAALAACSSTAIELKEKLGFPKRDQLVARVEDARDEQQEAKQEFASALEEFLAVTGAASDVKVAELEKRYSELKRAYDRSESQAGDVRSRIEDVERVAEALFKEWKKELAEYSSADLRRASQRQYDDTRDQYERLLRAMRTAESKMQPVLGAFKDQLLFLKHNLNARAIASLQSTSSRIESDVRALIAEMESAISEANLFIQQMQSAE